MATNGRDCWPCGVLVESGHRLVSDSDDSVAAECLEKGMPPAAAAESVAVSLPAAASAHSLFHSAIRVSGHGACRSEIAEIQSER